MSLVNVVLVLVALVVNVPFVLRGVAKLLSKFRNPAVQLGSKTALRERRHTRLQILTAGMTVTMLLFMAWSVTTDIFTGYLTEFEDKVLVTNVHSTIADSPNLEGIADVEGVKSAVPLIWRQGKMVEAGKGKIVNIIGSEKALDLIDFAFVSDDKETMKQILLTPGNIVIDKAYQELYGINLLDKVTVEIDGKSAVLTVAGITRHKLFNGNYIIASLTLYKWDAESLGNVFDLVGTLAIVMVVLVYMVLIASAVASRPNGEKGRTAMLSAGMSRNTLLSSECFEYALNALVSFVTSFAVSVLMTASLIGALRLFGLYFEFMYSADVVAYVGLALSAGYTLIPLLAGVKKKYTLKRQK